MMEQVKPEACPECGSKSLVFDPNSGETVCSSCGLVVKEVSLDSGFDVRAYTFEEKQKRMHTGAPATLTIHDKGLATVFSVGTDAYGRPLSASTKASFYRLKNLQKRCRIAPREKSLVLAMGELDKFADKMGVPKAAVEKAALLVHKALGAGLVKGRTIDGVVGGALYMACRQSEVLRGLDDVALACGLKRKQVAACYRLLLNGLSVSVPPLTSPLSYINKIVGELGLSVQAQGEIFGLVRSLGSCRPLMGKNPKTLAAIVVYVACRRVGERDRWGSLITQKRIAGVVGVTEVTLRNSSHDFLAVLESLNNQESKNVEG